MGEVRKRVQYPLPIPIYDNGNIFVSFLQGFWGKFWKENYYGKPMVCGVLRCGGGDSRGEEKVHLLRLASSPASPQGEALHFGRFPLKRKPFIARHIPSGGSLLDKRADRRTCFRWSALSAGRSSRSFPLTLPKAVPVCRPVHSGHLSCHRRRCKG